MITDLQIQHELLKTALEATDNYLAIEKRAKEAGIATNTMVHSFSYEMARAHDALQSLGVLNQHQDYMHMHMEELIKLHGHKDPTIEDIPYSHIPTADFGEVEEENNPYKDLNFLQESQDSRPAYNKFKSFLSEKKSEEELTLSEEDINKIVENLSWEDIIDLYNEDELVEEEPIEEGLSAQARLKKRQSFARFRSKRNVAKGIKLRRASTPQVLQKRAKLAARRAIYRRLLRGRNKSTLSAAEKDRIEQQVARMKNIQASIAMRMVPKMRAIEQKRLAHFRKSK